MLLTCSVLCSKTVWQIYLRAFSSNLSVAMSYLHRISTRIAKVKLNETTDQRKFFDFSLPDFRLFRFVHVWSSSCSELPKRLSTTSSSFSPWMYVIDDSWLLVSNDELFAVGSSMTDFERFFVSKSGSTRPWNDGVAQRIGGSDDERVWPIVWCSFDDRSEEYEEKPLDFVILSCCWSQDSVNCSEDSLKFRWNQKKDFLQTRFQNYRYDLL